jgi:hypothetical protein
MAMFRRVEDAQAGPTALGILIPPSRRTFLILRPRSLGFDLVLLRYPDATAFRELSHDEAAAAAHQLYRALEQWAFGGEGAIEIVANETNGGSWLRVQVGPFFLVACTRVPGEPYRPAVFADAESGRQTVTKLAPLICPKPGVEQELYFNTRHFQA